MVLWLSIWRLPLLWQRRQPPLAIIGTGRAFRSITTSIRLTTTCSDVGITAGTSPRRAILPRAMSTSRTGMVTSLTARPSTKTPRPPSATRRYATSALARPSCSTPTRAGSFNRRLVAGDDDQRYPRVLEDTAGRTESGVGEIPRRASASGRTETDLPPDLGHTRSER